MNNQYSDVTRERSCCGKKRYRSYWQADAVIEQMEDESLHSYWCRFCRGIHLGHPRGPAKETLTADQKKVVIRQLRTELLKADLKLARIEVRHGNPRKLWTPMAIIFRECRAAGMSEDEITAELKRSWLRMQNLEEGLTIEQAERSFLKSILACCYSFTSRYERGAA